MRSRMTAIRRPRRFRSSDERPVTAHCSRSWSDGNSAGIYAEAALAVGWASGITGCQSELTKG